MKQLELVTISKQKQQLYGKVVGSQTFNDGIILMNIEQFNHWTAGAAAVWNSFLLFEADGPGAIFKCEAASKRASNHQQNVQPIHSRGVDQGKKRMRGTLRNNYRKKKPS